MLPDVQRRAVRSVGSCSLLATRLDYEILAQQGVAIAAAAFPYERLPRRRGVDVARELGGRFLIRYLRPQQVGAFIVGTEDACWVSPTAYTPEEAIIYLALTNPTVPRDHALLLNPARIPTIVGLQWALS